MKNTFRHAFMLVALLILSACYNDSSPKLLLNSIAVSVAKDDLPAYQKFFTGQAKVQYGNAQGLQILKSKGISADRKLTQSKAVLHSRTSIGVNTWNKIFSVDVLDQSTGSVVASAKVTCEEVVTINREFGACRVDNCIPSDPDTVSTNTCKVFELRFR